MKKIKSKADAMTSQKRFIGSTATREENAAESRFRTSMFEPPLTIDPRKINIGDDLGTIASLFIAARVGRHFINRWLTIDSVSAA
jgi:hypothetical protein